MTYQCTNKERMPFDECRHCAGIQTLCPNYIPNLERMRETIRTPVLPRNYEEWVRQGNELYSKREGRNS